jgi:DNA (cytosine-5)-methyltransferase 1
VCFSNTGEGYNISVDLLDAKDYGIPQTRKRIIIIGIRKDIGLFYRFPDATHGPCSRNRLLYASHGEAIAYLPINGSGEYYDYSPEPFSWWYMSRNRKRRWEDPSYAIQANWRHVPLHPASPTMQMVESNLKDGFKQRWEFTKIYDHLDSHPNAAKLEKPRRLSWRECAAIQTFPVVIVKGLINGDALNTQPQKPNNKSLDKLIV